MCFSQDLYLYWAYFSEHDFPKCQGAWFASCLCIFHGTAEDLEIWNPLSFETCPLKKNDSKDGYTQTVVIRNFLEIIFGKCWSSHFDLLRLNIMNGKKTSSLAYCVMFIRPHFCCDGYDLSHWFLEAKVVFISWKKLNYYWLNFKPKAAKVVRGKLWFFDSACSKTFQ